jgi:3-methylcrotonyl-CoA carboxylase alpha subunit
VNTRLQVEHPITEEVTGLDLVRLQIEVAEGKSLPLTQEEIKQNGHAIEVRIYAEDPANNFLPVSGKIIDWRAAELPGMRYDTGIESGSEISTFYDPMIAKVIAKGKDREEAIAKMSKALQELVLTGFTTNKNFLYAVLQNTDFRKGDFDTHFLDNKFNYQGENYPQATLDILTVALQHYRFLQRENQRTLAKGVQSGWRNNFYQQQEEKYAYQGFEFSVHYSSNGDILNISFADKNFTSVHHPEIQLSPNSITLEIDGVRRSFYISQNGNQYFIHCAPLGQISLLQVNRFQNPNDEVIKGGYTAPMPGEVTKVYVKNGDTVKAGDKLLVMISMKMENTISAIQDGVVAEICAKEGDSLAVDQLIIRFE